MKPILVTGGAGYIGSHAVKALLDAGREVVVVDNLSAGKRAAVDKRAQFEQADTRDIDAMKRIILHYHPSAVMHFAAWLAVEESMQKPLEYYDNNVVGVLRLLEAMAENQVNQFIFSSTCAIFGQPDQVPVTEYLTTHPESPYGQTKLAVEQMLPWVEKAHGIKSVALRYFNAAGADESGQLGLDTPNPTQLIPRVINAALNAQPAEINGVDWPTPDGTCIRDYIHVTDLADAHLKAVEYLEKGGASTVYNLGTGHGSSVKQVIDAVEKVSGKKIERKINPRRPGDPAQVYANSAKAQKELHWVPRYQNIEDIVRTAWRWHSTHPHGFDTSA